MFNIRFLIFILLSCMPVEAAFLSPHTAKQAMVTSASPYATQIGLTMLKQGGNAIDAAVATAFAISVAEPFSAGIGGGGFLLVYLAKTQQILSLDFRETAPMGASKNMYLDKEGRAQQALSLDGYLSVATPGTVAGLYEVHRKYGVLPWAKVVAPAITLAQNGFVIDRKFVQNFKERKNALAQNKEAWRIFTRAGKPLGEGDTLRQQDLAKTLRLIAKQPKSFYHGHLATKISNDMKKNGGLVTLNDLKSYEPKWREPTCSDFKGMHICSMPPPSSGGVILVEMLNMLEHANFPLERNDPRWMHVATEIMKIAYADRAAQLGDPDFVQNPIDLLTTKTYAKTRYDEISTQARPSSSVKSLEKNRQALNRHESNDTSHLNVVDAAHNAVSLTFTVNYGFGSGVVVPGTGILLNDEMDDFASANGVPNAYGLVGSEANAIAPRKIPLSSMTPVIALRDGHFAFAMGSPGGSRIITTIFQSIVNMLVFGMNVSEAIGSPRFHHQWQPDKLSVEQNGFDPLTLKELKKMGHDIEERSTWCNANAIVAERDGSLQGAADPRGIGLAQGF